MFIKRILLGFPLALLFLAGCKTDPDFTGQDDIDRQLIAQLEKQSPSSSIAYFILPNSDDYTSIPQDPRNPITDAKIELGKQLYHETCIGLDVKGPSMNLQTYSCASCHHAAAGFQSGVRQGIGEGGSGFGFQGEGRSPIPGFVDSIYDVQPVKSPSILNAAYQEAQLWNGQFGAVGPNVGTESQWTPGTPKEANTLGYHGVETQAIAGLTVHRLRIDTQLISVVPGYASLFEAAYPGLSGADQVNTINAALAIAAYERTVLANQSPFQDWLKGDYSAMSEDEKRGAILFFGKAECYKCHTGPALNSMEFHALGMGDLLGSEIINSDPYDAAHTGRGGFTGNPSDDYKFKVPQIYNLREALVYGHGATFATIEDVVKYKNTAVKGNSNVPDGQLSEHFKPLNLTKDEIEQITQFLYLSLHDDNLERYVPSSLLSDFCFPNNDPQSRTDLGCQ